MSFHHLIEGECGGSNSLVQLSSILSRDASVNVHRNPHEQYVDEFLLQNQMPPPETFRMNTLLHSLKGIQEDGSSMANTARPENWADEFNQMPANTPNIGPGMWNAMPHGPRQYPLIMPHYVSLQPNMNDRPIVQLEYLDDQQYDPMYSAEGEIMEQDSSQREIQEKANDLVEAVVDQNVAYSQFISFMKKVGGGEVSLEMPGESTSQTADGQIISDQGKPLLTQEHINEWERLPDVTQHPWLSQFGQKTNPFSDYNFTDENSMLNNPDALEIGKQKLKLGDVPGAVLCFEASVKSNPAKAEGWLLLGTTQAENEQDPQAIAALSKCVEIDPTCLAAYMALGASFHNENYPHLAYQAFNNWLKANQQYSDLVPLDVDISNMNNVQMQDHLQSIFIRAAQMNPAKIDPDIQSALGVLFNISQEYNKAVDCFKTALMVRADDSRLWNRLGATLANGERSEEAVDAYYQALKLEPGFIRARYNVGITCMNLGAHKEAAEHLLIALNQQVKAQGLPFSTSQQDTSSSTIWSTLRMVCAFMGKHDIIPSIDSRDLNKLNESFGLSDQ